MKKKTFSLSLTAVSAVLGFMLTIQIASRTPATSSTEITSFLDLRTQLAVQTQERQLLMKDVSKAQSQIAQFEASEGSRAAMGKAIAHDEETVAAQAGMTPVTGPGITITIQFDPNLQYIDKYANMFDNYSDQEISLIVNDLFANGATAISINGQRLVTTSTIRLVSGLADVSTLQVNTVPVTSPYVITAVGNVNLMQAVLTLNQVVPDLNLMQEDCLIAAHPGPKGVTVPAYTGTLPGTFAKEVNAQ